jgi:probable rRNA maturation factor
MFDADIMIEDSRWTALELEPLTARAITPLAKRFGLEDFEFSILATTDGRIAELNGQFRAKHQATNVLSWPNAELSAEDAGDMPEPPEPDFPGEPLALGDIALAYETCAAEAEAAERPLKDHVTQLIVHGFLHLLGFDHIRDPDAHLMEAIEVDILAQLGLPDPYE